MSCPVLETGDNAHSNFPLSARVVLRQNAELGCDTVVIGVKYPVCRGTSVHCYTDCVDMTLTLTQIIISLQC